MEHPIRPLVHTRWLRILALVPLVTSCAGSASLSGLLVPRGLSPDERLDEAVVYVQSEDTVPGDHFPAPAGRASLTFSRASLRPAVSVAMVGTWLEIWNSDEVFHQPFSRSKAAPFEGRSVRPSSGTAVPLRSQGLVQIFCQLHAGESAELLVLKTGAWTRPDSSGVFAFPPLPRGRYVIHAWHPRLGEQTVPLEVERRGPMSVELRY